MLRSLLKPVSYTCSLYSNTSTPACTHLRPSTGRLRSDRDHTARLGARQLQPQPTVQLLLPLRNFDPGSLAVLDLQGRQVLLSGPFFSQLRSHSAQRLILRMRDWACQTADWKAHHKTECKALIEAAKKNGGAVPDTPVRALGRLVWLKAKEIGGAVVSGHVKIYVELFAETTPQSKEIDSLQSRTSHFRFAATIPAWAVLTRAPPPSQIEKRWIQRSKSSSFSFRSRSRPT